MSIIPEQSYPGKIAEASAEYPYGSARNITTPGDGTGTPLEQAWLNDDWGFKQALLKSAGVVPNGAPDTAESSQYLEALGIFTDARPVYSDDVIIKASEKYKSRKQRDKNLEFQSLTDFKNIEATPGFDNAPGINAAMQSGGKAFFVPSGVTLEKQGDLVIPAGVVLFGAGSSSVIKDTRESVNAQGLRVGGDGAGAHSLRLLGANPGGVTTFINGNNAIVGSGYNDVAFYNLDIEGWACGGVSLKKCDNSFVRNNRIKHVGRFGVFVLGGENTHVWSNVIKHVKPGNGGVAPFLNAYGISFTSDTGVPGDPACRLCSAIANVIEDVPSWEGLDIHGGEDITVAFNKVKDTALGCYVGASTGGNNRVTKNALITGNTFRTSTPLRRAGILVNPTYDSAQALGENITITGNTIDGYGLNAAAITGGVTGREAAIYVTGALTCAIQGNTITNFNQMGIFIRQRAFGVNITGNTVRNGTEVDGLNWCLGVEDVTKSIVFAAGNSFYRSGGTLNGVTTFNDAGVDGDANTAGFTLGDNAFTNLTKEFGDNLHAHINRRSHEITRTQSWGKLTVASTGAKVKRGVNTSTASRTAVGVTVVSFRSNPPDTNYSVALTPHSSAPVFAVISAVEISQFTITTYNIDGSPVDADVSYSVNW